MEGLGELIVTSAINGILNGFTLLWESLIAHPLLLFFLIVLIVISLSVPKRIH